MSDVASARTTGIVLDGPVRPGVRRPVFAAARAHHAHLSEGQPGESRLGLFSFFPDRQCSQGGRHVLA
jgi:hypothetical protein